jgi:hypothetical protein
MFSEMNSEKNILKHSNPLWSLILAFPNKPWNWYDVSMNPWTTLDVIKKYDRTKLHWHALAKRLMFSNEFLEIAFSTWNHPLQLHVSKLSGNPSLPFEFVLNHPEIKWNLNNLSECMPLKTIKNYIEWHWNWDYVAVNPNITVDFIDSVGSHNGGSIIWSFKMLSLNPNITVEFFYRHQNETWNTNNLYVNKCITLEWLERLPFEAYWNASQLSSNKDAERMLLKFPTWNWDFKELSKNTNLHVETVLKCSDKPWNYVDVVRHHRFDINNLPESSKLDLALLLENYHLQETNLLGLDTRNIVVFSPRPNVKLSLYQIMRHAPYEYIHMFLLKYFPDGHPLASGNNHISWLYIKTNPTMCWNFHMLSYNNFGRNMI